MQEAFSRHFEPRLLQDPFTLIIALDDKQSASGSLYLDDGRSFAHEGGHFSNTTFTFGNGALTCKVQPNSSAVACCWSSVSH